MGAIKYIADKLFSNDQEVVVLGEGGIESGSNGSHKHTKFPDGTLICTGYVYDTGSTDFEVEYSHPFIGGPNITVTGKIEEASLLTKVVGTTWSDISDNTHIHIVATQTHLEANYIAIGQWK